MAVLNKALDILRGDTPKLRIFISHAHADEELVRAVVTLIERAFETSDVPIRYISVPGYMLEGGVNTSSQLRGEIQASEFVLGVLTPHSIASKYVLLELGAAWGLGKRTFPLAARGVEVTGVPGPLGELHWIDLRKSAQCHQLVSDMKSGPLGARARQGKEAAIADAVDLLVPPR